MCIHSVNISLSLSLQDSSIDSVHEIESRGAEGPDKRAGEVEIRDSYFR